MNYDLLIRCTMQENLAIDIVNSAIHSLPKKMQIKYYRYNFYSFDISETVFDKDEDQVKIFFLYKNGIINSTGGH